MNLNFCFCLSNTTNGSFFETILGLFVFVLGLVLLDPAKSDLSFALLDIFAILVSAEKVVFPLEALGFTPASLAKVFFIFEVFVLILFFANRRHSQ